ncbi:DUF2059 domain-containing protein [Wenxinia marina]|uniref:DUF2059 domain-containing protein n=1 Tax=Wenxinia marina DSM 24838 TaxID=1123501 RepID=A0A0D0Q9Q8_9RHOB|nr:DUF2059 domain-containing protein [Wenxinia marina]KIQ67753.1 Uncharacterized protein Wenmar_03712 [Wenxinia marina DSM 24838]GGL77513.1 hypothetical protein GCM10011392_34940 [Wenxinia marina]
MSAITVTRTALAAALVAAPFAAPAQEAEGDVDALFEALLLPEVLGVMQQEGVGYGAEVGEDLFESAVSASWSDGVAAIYDAERMEREVRAAFAEALEGEDLAPMIEFFTEGAGRTAVALELSAREAMLDEEVEEAAREAAALAMADGTERSAQLERFVEANDLVETNVVSAMNSNVAFYLGLMDGGALPAQLTEDQILADVWGQEPEIRQTTTEWIYSFLGLAYQPLSDEDLEAYTAFSETEPGQTLNRAVFEAFDAPFEAISHDLGRLAAQYMVQQDI